MSGDLTLALNSWIYPYSHPTNGGSPLFEMDNLVIAAGSAINASWNGYAGGAAGFAGKGPGYGSGSGVTSGGAGHGGRSGTASGLYGQTYGSSAAPIEPGSGGGNGGGAGGGVIRIAAANTVTVNGSLLADGQTYPVYGGGGGAGGSIYVQCQILEGTGGVLSAVGGGGSGGGGRIAVIFNSAAQSNAPLPDVKFTTAGGWWGNYPDDKRGDVGTLYFTDSQFLTRTNLIVHSGQWLAPDLADGWTADSLILSNTWLRFNTEGYRLAVNGNLSIVGTDGTLHMLQLSNGVAWCGGDLLMNNASMRLYAGATSGPSLACGGALTLTNNAWIHVYSAPTNGVAPDYGALVSVTGLMTVASGSWVFPYSHSTNGGSALFRLNDLLIGTNAGFNANDKGYSGSASVGFGPGRGNSGSPGGGGGYGGFGGRAAFPYGQTYGSTNAPLSPGSGGGGTGGAGGGLVRIEAAGSVDLKGSILAKGQGFTGYMNTSGSGGGIFVMCQEFASVNGVINADGGTGNSAGSGGGGGRIAVWHGVPESERARILAGDRRGVVVTNAWAGCTASATNGLYGTAAPTPGTVVFLTVKKNPGTLIIVR